MVRKIQGSEYLKRYDNMSAVEQAAYLKRVGEWLETGGRLLPQKAEAPEARFQNVQQVSVGWNDVECRAFEEGVVLLSAHAATNETWLPDMLYVKAAKRSIMRMVEVLEAAEPVSSVRFLDKPSGKAERQGSSNPADKTSGNSGEQKGASNGDIAVGDKDGEGQNKEDVRGKKEEGRTQTSSIEHQPSAIVPVRPKHIDQYVHLLPQGTQERAAKYGPLMRELEEAREKLRLLTEDRTAKSDDRAAWAKRVSSIDKEIGGIKRELDSEWEKLVKSGRVTVDDLGNAHVVPTGEPEGTVSGDKVQVSSEKVELTPEQRERRKNMRKWLTDTRRGNGAAREERVKKWHENFKEYLTMEGDAAFKDEKIIEAAKHYGIDFASLKVKSEE